MATKSSIDAKHAIKTGRVQEGIKYWCALFDYDANHQDELTLKRGTQVEVITKDPKVSGTDGWWTGKVNDKVGVFPSNFVTAQVTPPQAKQIRAIKFSDLQLHDVIGTCRVFLVVGESVIFIFRFRNDNRHHCQLLLQLQVCVILK